MTTWYFDDPASATGGVTSTAGQSPVASPTTVPTGSLGTGYKFVPAQAPAMAGTAENDKEAFVAFGLGAAPKGTKIASFVVTVPVDTTDTTSLAEVMSPNTPPAIVACRSAGLFTAPAPPATNPQGYSKAPAVDCGAEQVAGVFDPTSMSYSFTIPAMAQKWVDGTNTGVAFIQDPSVAPAASYTLSLGPVTKIAVVASAVAAPAPTASPTASPTPAKTTAAATESPAPAATTSDAPSPTPKATPKATAKPTPTVKKTTVAPTPVQTTSAPPAVTPTTAAPAVVPPVSAVLPAVVQPASAPVSVDAPSIAPSTDAPTSDAPAAQPAATSAAAVVPVVTQSLAPAAAKSPTEVKGPFGAVAWIVLALVVLGVVAAISLSLSATPSATGGATGTSRLTRLLNGGSASS